MAEKLFAPGKELAKPKNGRGNNAGRVLCFFAV